MRSDNEAPYIDEPTETWRCPSCEQARSTPFCSQCGERKLRANELTVQDLVEQVWGAVSNLDARLFRSVKLLLLRPGELTVAYLSGRRRRYLGPVSLFFFANAVFFAVQSLTHTNIFSSTLDSHLHQQDWSGTAQVLVARHLEARHLTLGAYARVFDEAVVLNAKSLIILMALTFASLLPWTFFGERRPIGAHVVFSLHLYAFILLLFCVSLLAVELDFFRGGLGLLYRPLDILVSLFNLAVASTYLHLSMKAVYGGRGVVAFCQSAILAVALAAIVLGYRFVIFLITLYFT